MQAKKFNKYNKQHPAKLKFFEFYIDEDSWSSIVIYINKKEIILSLMKSSRGTGPLKLGNQPYFYLWKGAKSCKTISF